MASSESARVRFARRMADGEGNLRLYAILDRQSCEQRGLDLIEVARAWRDAGVRLLQLRDKESSDSDVLRRAEQIAAVFRTPDTFLLLNDRAHLVSEAGWDGVHVGQDDGDVTGIRSLVGDDALIGLSSHTPAQAEAAGEQDVDYVACGPVFATATKADAEPVIGMCGLQAIRAIARKPLVAIGGLDVPRAQQARRSGADAVALISALLPATEASSPDRRRQLQQQAQDFLLALQ